MGVRPSTVGGIEMVDKLYNSAQTMLSTCIVYIKHLFSVNLEINLSRWFDRVVGERAKKGRGIRETNWVG